MPDFFAPLEKWRGTYNGLVEGNHKEMCSVTSPPHKLPMASINWMLGGQKTSCTSVCAHKSMKCEVIGFSVPGAVLLKEYAKLGICKAWGAEYGQDQPAMVRQKGVNMCLVPCLGSMSTCDAVHHLTRRLCPCVVTSHNS